MRAARESISEHGTVSYAFRVFRFHIPSGVCHDAYCNRVFVSPIVSPTDQTFPHLNQL